MRGRIKDILKMINPDITKGEELDFIQEGLIDSLGMVELIEKLEEQFDISIEAEEIVPENFQTLDSIERLIRKREKYHHESK